MQVVCGQCGRSLDVEPSKAGQHIACPRCGGDVDVPFFDEATIEEAIASHGGEESEGFAEQVRSAMQRKIRVLCGACGKGLKVPSVMAGHKATCPACGKMILIPYPEGEGSPAPKASPQPSAKRATQAPPSPAEDQEGQPTRSPAQELAAATATMHGDRQPNGRSKSRSILGWAVMICLAVAGLGLGIALGMGWLGGGTSVRPEPSPRREPMDRHRRGEVSPSRNEPRRRPPAEIPKRQAAIRLVAVEPSLFAAEGYRPAPPGKIYWRVRTEITAGNATTVQTYGKEARLQLGDATITALGQAAGAPPMPLGWAPSVLKLVAGERRQVTLVFEVPAAAGVGKLTFGRFGTLDVGPVRSPKPGDADLEGLWGEVPPRNLKPLLEDPVMAALQHAADHSMRIERTGNELRISIPAAGVQGSLTPGRNGVHQALLRAGDATLTCKLRSYDDGRGMVLYLRERPFYQLTYRKQ